MKFVSRKDKFFTIILASVCALMLGVIILAFVEKTDLVGQIVVVSTSALVILLLVWLYFGTSYELNNRFLIYRSGPMKGRISVESIREIIRGETMWVGIKPATARNGLIIKYSSYDDVYISPEQETLFLEKLIEQNPAIKIINANEHPIY